MKVSYPLIGLWIALFATSYADSQESPCPDATSGLAQVEQVKISAAKRWRERRLAFGKGIYEQSCAACHDEGTDGAPAIGDREAWSRRSPLWMGVLLEHAKLGYLGMPAKGNHPELTDRAVDAAGEYMLSETFPEKPLD